MYDQIDVLDSDTSGKEVKQKWHQHIASRIRTQLAGAISKITPEKSDINKWSMPIVSVAKESDGVSSSFFAMMFLNHYNPDDHKVVYWDKDKEIPLLKRRFLWYLINHKLNEERSSLPEGIMDILRCHHP